MSFDSLSVIFVSFGVKACLALVAWFFLRVALTNLDNLAGFKFREWLNSEDNGVGKGIYLGARIIAMAYLFASILS